jgi:hypothetical protein
MAHNLCLIVHYVPPVNENMAFGARDTASRGALDPDQGSRSGAI